MNCRPETSLYLKAGYIEVAGVGLNSQEQKHNFEVLPLNHLGSSEMIAFEFIASLSVLDIRTGRP